jgi:hypothetical protein
MKETAILLIRLYLGISFLHFILISIINNGEAMVKHGRGIKLKRIRKERIKRRYALVWPLVWYRVIEGFKNERHTDKDA